MSVATTPILKGVAQGDFDMAGKRLLNWDNSNYPSLGGLVPKPAHTVLIGPAGGGDATPTWRLAVASEFGAQPHTSTLDTLSGLTPTTSGIGLLQLANPTNGGYAKNSGLLGGFTWSTLTAAQLLADINAETHTSTLSLLGALTSTVEGRALIGITGITAKSYPRLNADGTSTAITPTQLIADLGIVAAPFLDSTAIIKSATGTNRLLKISSVGIADSTTRTMSVPNYDFTVASLLGSEALRNKLVNGLTLAAGASLGTVDGITYSDTPANPFILALVAGNAQTGTNLVLRTTAATDLVLPVSGTLATVAGTLPASYLETKIDLGGSGSSDAKIPSQLAAKTYVDAHGAHSPPPALDTTIASATTTDLDAAGATKKVIGISGSVTISAMTLSTSGDWRIVVFTTGGNALTDGVLFQLPGRKPIVTKANDWAVVRSYGSGVVKLIRYYDSTANGERKGLSSLVFSPNVPIKDGDGNMIFCNVDMGANGGNVVGDTSLGSIFGVRSYVAGGGSASGKQLTAGFFGTFCGGNMSNATNGPIALDVICDGSSGFTSTVYSAARFKTQLDGVATTSIGIQNLCQTVGGNANYNSLIGQLTDIFNAGSSIINNPIILQGKIRTGPGTITGTAKGISLESWTGSPTTSYGIYMDASIGIGATSYAIYSLTTAPSVITGDVSLGALLHLTPTTFGNLPVGSFGDVRALSDAGQNTLGSAVTSGGSTNKVIVWYNGTAWTCIAK